MREATATQSTGVGRAASRLRRAQGQPPPVWVHAHRGASQETGVALPQDAKRKLWAIHPCVRGMGKAPGLAPPRNEMGEWMRSSRAVPGSMTIGTESRPRRIAQPIAYRGEATEAVGLQPLAECHLAQSVELC
jgi:hypothetical protein